MLNKMAISKFWSDDFGKNGHGRGPSCPSIFGHLKRALELFNFRSNEPSRDILKPLDRYDRSHWIDRIPQFRESSDRILVKLKIPHHLLQPSINLSKNELRLQLNPCCEQIIYALKCADKAAIPVRRIHCKSGKYRWSTNPVLVSACATAKWWLRLWDERERPRTGL